MSCLLASFSPIVLSGHHLLSDSKFLASLRSLTNQPLAGAASSFVVLCLLVVKMALKSTLRVGIFPRTMTALSWIEASISIQLPVLWLPQSAEQTSIRYKRASAFAAPFSQRRRLRRPPSRCFVTAERRRLKRPPSSFPLMFVVHIGDISSFAVPLAERRRLYGPPSRLFRLEAPKTFATRVLFRQFCCHRRRRRTWSSSCAHGGALIDFRKPSHEGAAPTTREKERYHLL